MVLSSRRKGLDWMLGRSSSQSGEVLGQAAEAPPPGTKEQTMTTQPDWSEYLTQMTHLLDMELDAPRRK